MSNLQPIDPPAAQALLNERYAPGHFEAESFAVVTLPYGSEIPDVSDDEWDGVFVMQSLNDVTLLYYRLAAVPVQLEMFK